MVDMVSQAAYAITCLGHLVYHNSWVTEHATPVGAVQIAASSTACSAQLSHGQHCRQVHAALSVAALVIVL